MLHQYTDRWEISHATQLPMATVDDYVKVSNGKERFWIQVCDIQGEWIFGGVSNQLVGSAAYNVGDVVCVGPQHILDHLHGHNSEDKSSHSTSTEKSVVHS